MPSPFDSLLLFYLPALISHVSSATVYSPAQSFDDQTLAALFDTSSHTVLLNKSALSLNSISDLHAARAQCSGTQFGTDLNPASCTNAMLNIPSDPIPNSFGTREDGHSGPGYDVQLPWRWLSSMSKFSIQMSGFGCFCSVRCSRVVADGLCSVQLFLVAPATVAHVSANQIRRGAQAVFDQCVTGSPSRSGVASRTGAWRQ